MVEIQPLISAFCFSSFFLVFVSPSKVNQALSHADGKCTGRSKRLEALGDHRKVLDCILAVRQARGWPFGLGPKGEMSGQAFPAFPVFPVFLALFPLVPLREGA